MQLIVRQHLSAVLLYTVLAIVMTLPVIGNLTDRVVGTGGDPWQTMWRFEYKLSLAGDAVSQGALNEFLKEEFFGGGAARLVNLSVWPWIDFQLIFGQPLGYNIIWLLSFILSGYTMYLLVAYLLKGLPEQTKLTIGPFNVLAPALLAGLVYMFLPYHVAHASGHFGAMQLQWLPLLLWVLLHIVKTPNWKWLSALIVVGVVQAWTEHHYFLWFLMSLPIIIGFYWGDIKRLWQDHAGKVVIAALIMGTLLSASYWPTIRLALQPQSDLVLGQEQTVRFSADLFSYVIPASAHPVWGSLAFTLFNDKFTGNASENMHFLGLTSILLILFFHQRIPKRQKWLWFWLGLVFFLISLGPRLHVVGWVLPIPLPYALLDGLPIFSAVRAVGRAGVFVGLAASVLVGWAAATTLKRQRGYLILGAIVLLEFAFLPVSMQAFESPQVYQQVKELPGQTLIEIPAATNYTVASESLFHSLEHGKEVAGSIALERATGVDEFDEVRSLPGLRQVLYLRTTHIRELRDDFFSQELAETFVDSAHWIGAEVVLVHRDSLTALQLATVQRFFAKQLGLEAQQYGDVLLYNLAESEIKGDGLFLARDGSWENVGFDPERDSVFAEVPRTADLMLYNNTDITQQVALEFTIAPESHGNLRLVAAGQTEEQVVLADLVLSGGAHTIVPVALEPGVTQVTFENRLPDKVIIQNPRFVTSGQ